MKTLFLLLFTMTLSSLSVQAIARNGYDGSNGKNKTITASTYFIDINLSGEDGEDGRDGHDGGTGRCHSYTNDDGETVSDNVRGEDGEDGGDGGDGGNGGNLTVLFTNYVDLKNIRFVSYGGAGGSGGYGGDGGSGCPNGSNGSHGSRGYNGVNGNLFLVSQEFHPYQIDNSNELTTLETLASRKVLVKNIWEELPEKNYINESSVYNKHFNLKDYQFGSAKVIFNDPNQIDPRLLRESMQVHMSDEVTVIKPGKNFLHISQHSDPSPHAVLQIERLYKTDEFKSIEYNSVEGTTGSRIIKMSTRADLVPRPNLIMDLKVEVKGRFFKYYEIFNGKVPKDFIRKIEAGYIIELDKLPLSKKIDKKAKIRLSMKYTLSEMGLTHSDEEVWVVKVD